MKKVTLKVELLNRFHNRSITLRAHRGRFDFQSGDFLFLSMGQTDKARRFLCGVKGCTCSNALGINTTDYILVDGIECGIDALVTDEETILTLL